MSSNNIDLPKSQTRLVLAVDDEPDLLEMYEAYLSKSGYQCVTALNGAKAIEVLSNTDNVFLVITDARMPEVHGAALLGWIKINRPHLEVIIVSGFSKLTETFSAESLGCVAVLSKPISREDLIKRVDDAWSRSVLNIGQGAEVRESSSDPIVPIEPEAEPSVSQESVAGWRARQASLQTQNAAPQAVAESSPVDSTQTLPSAEDVTNQYRAIPLASFQPMSLARLNCYLKEGGTFTQMGQLADIGAAEIQNLLAKGIKQLWIHIDDLKEYEEIVRAEAKNLVHRFGVSDEKKGNFFKHALLVSAENLCKVGFSEENISSATKLFTESIEPFAKSATSLNAFRSLEETGVFLVDHAATTALLCSLLAKIMGWSSSKNISVLCMGGYFHDIGLGELPEEMRTKSLALLSEEDAKLYRKHPILGAKKLKSVPGIPEEVIRIVAQHHETGGGQGYPKGLPRGQVFPMSKTVMMVDAFSEAMFMHNKKLGAAVPSDVLEDVLANPDYVGLDQAAMVAMRIALKENDLVKAQRQYAKQMGGGRA